ncbi:MAG: hypothetical protein HY553_18125 [Elusimicrobia bacterium]|nr:hypothetical protein [Elusimicrobiota bacterium]
MRRGFLSFSWLNDAVQARATLPAVAAITMILVAWNAAQWTDLGAERPSVSALPKGGTILVSARAARPGSGRGGSLGLAGLSDLAPREEVRDALATTGRAGAASLMTERRAKAPLDGALAASRESQAEAAAAGDGGGKGEGPASEAADPPAAPAAAPAPGIQGPAFGLLSGGGGPAGGIRAPIEGAAGAPGSRLSGPPAAGLSGTLNRAARARSAARLLPAPGAPARALDQLVAASQLSRAATASVSEGSSALARRAFTAETIATGGASPFGPGASVGPAAAPGGSGSGPSGSVGGAGLGAGTAAPAALPVHPVGGSALAPPNAATGALAVASAPAVPKAEKNVTPYQGLVTASAALLLAGAALLLASKLAFLSLQTQQLLRYAAAACGGAAAVLGVTIMAQHGQYLQSIVLVAGGGALIYAALAG